MVRSSRNPIDPSGRSPSAPAPEGKLRSHELVPCGEMLDSDGVEQLRGPPVESEAVPADESRVARVEANVILGEHRRVGLADQELSVVVDGEGRRPNRDWHALPMLPGVTLPVSLPTRRLPFGALVRLRCPRVDAIARTRLRAIRRPYSLHVRC